MIIFELVNKGIGDYGLGGTSLEVEDLLLIKEDNPSGGGDVYQNADNSFTGVNEFSSPPTSNQDAVEPDELVRFSQLAGLGGEGVIETLETFEPTLIDGLGGATYSLSLSQGTKYTIGNFVAIYIRMNIISTTGTPIGALVVGNIPPTLQSQVVGGTLRKFAGSNQTDLDIALAYPRNTSSMLTSLFFEKKTTSNLSAVVINDGRITLSYFLVKPLS